MSSHDPLDDYTGDPGRDPRETDLPEDPVEHGEPVPGSISSSGDDAVAPIGGKRESMTQSLQRKTSKVKSERPRQWNGLIIVGLCLFVGMIMIGVFALKDKGTARSAPPQITPGYDTAPDINAKFDTFMSTVSSELVGLKKQVSEAHAQNQSMQQSVKEQIAAQSDAQRSLQVRVEQELQNIKSQVREPATNSATVVKGDIDAFVQVLRRQKKAGNLSLAEARIRLNAYLGNEGFKDRDLHILRDRCLDQLGFLYVGEVNEPALSADELSTLPVELRGTAKELAAYNVSIGENTGRVLFREEESIKWLRQTLGEAKCQELGQTNLSKAAFLARVRKANVTGEQEALLPDLAAQRDRSGIAVGDLFRTEAMVFDQKKRWPMLTPGQHLSLTMALSGVRGQASGDLSGPRSREVTQSDTSLVEGAVKSALDLALNQNIRDQKSLLERGNSAAKASIADLGVEMAPAQIDALVVNVLADLLRSKMGTTNKPPQSVETKQPRAETKTAEVVELHLGPFALRQQQAGTFAWLLSGLAAERLKIDPNTVEGAGAISAAWTASQTLGETAWVATAERGGDLREFVNVVLGELHGIFDAGKRAGAVPASIKGLDGEVASFVQAMVLGEVAGSTYDASRDVQDQALQRALSNLQNDGSRINGLVNNTGVQRLSEIWKGLGYPSPLGGPDRLSQTLTVLGKQVVERQVAHQQIALSGFPQEFRDRIVRNLNDDLIISLPAAAIQSDDGRMAPDLLERLVIVGENRYSVAAVAEAILSAQGMKEVVDRFANLVDRDDMIKPLSASLSQWIPDQVHAVLMASRPEISDTTIGNIANEVASKILPDLDQFLAKQVIFGNLEPRISQAAGSLNQPGMAKALDHIRARLAGIALRPVTPSAIDKLTQTLHEEGLAVLNGEAAGMRPGVRGIDNGPPRPLPTRPAFFDVPDSGLPGIPLGMQKDSIDSRVRSIPMGSSMYCVLETGAAISIKQNDNVNTIFLRAKGGFLSPSGNWYQFPNAVIKGTMKPNMNGDSINVELQAMSFDLPNGVRIEKEISGIVVNQVDGVAGMVAKFNRNLDKILPEAATVALLEGGAAALGNQNQTVQVSTTGSTIVTSGGDAFAQGTSQGITEGVQLVIDYEKTYLDSISPTLESPNGQPLTAIFAATVDFPELTDEDWLSFSASGRRGNDGF